MDVFSELVRIPVSYQNAVFYTYRTFSSLDPESLEKASRIPQESGIINRLPFGEYRITQCDVVPITFSSNVILAQNVSFCLFELRYIHYNSPSAVTPITDVLAGACEQSNSKLSFLAYSLGSMQMLAYGSSFASPGWFSFRSNFSAPIVFDNFNVVVGEGFVFVIKPIWIRMTMTHEQYRVTYSGTSLTCNPFFSNSRPLHYVLLHGNFNEGLMWGEYSMFIEFLRN